MTDIKNPLFWPVCKMHANGFLIFGLKKRPNARRPNFGALERHRFTWLFFEKRTNLMNGRRKSFLHVAREFCLSRGLKEVPDLVYPS
jgi:hypothetical protein